MDNKKKVLHFLYI
jgi:hypothetical protein